MRRTLLALAALLPTLAFAAGTAETTVFTQGGEVPLSLEIASTPKEREKGLMKRYELAPYDGMIFLFPEPGTHRFWMKDTPISLDMLFVDEARTIVHIAEYTKPYSTLPIGSGRDNITAVIELDGGSARRKGIAVGDSVRYALPESIRID